MELRMQIKLFIIILLFSPFVSGEEICGVGKIKYILKQKEVIKTVSMCENIKKFGEYIYSINCRALDCRFVKDPYKKPISLKKYARSVGSPGFKVCRELKGSPQIIQYQLNSKEWKQDARCIFGKSSFVSNHILMSIWKDYILY